VNKAKIKGTAWESACVEYLKRWWPKMKRAALEGTGDIGDLALPEGWAVECKNAQTINLPQFLREAESEAANKGVRNFVALVKNRRSKGESGAVWDGYAVTRTRVWARIAYEHERARETLEYLTALDQRLRTGGINESAYAVLARESLAAFSDDMARTGD
jgi:hypothetical protein